MKYLIYLVAIILILGLNIGIFQNFYFGKSIPNLLLLFTLCFTLDNQGFDFVFVAFFSGIFLDFFSPEFFGGYTIAFLLINYLIYLLMNSIVNIQIKFRTLVFTIIFAIALNTIIIWLFGLITYKLNLTANYVVFKEYFSNFFYELIYGLMLIYPMYLLANNLRIWVENLNSRRRGIVR